MSSCKIGKLGQQIHGQRYSLKLCCQKVSHQTIMDQSEAHDLLVRGP